MCCNASNEILLRVVCFHLISDPKIAQNLSVKLHSYLQSPLYIRSPHLLSMDEGYILHCSSKCPCVFMIRPAMPSSCILYSDCSTSYSPFTVLQKIPAWTSIPLPLHWAISGCISPQALQHALPSSSSSPWAWQPHDKKLIFDSSFRSFSINDGKYMKHSLPSASYSRSSGRRWCQERIRSQAENITGNTVTCAF